MTEFGVRRWPLHPEPAPMEALSSWLGRVAGCYELYVHELLAYNLGPASMLLTDGAGQLRLLDGDPLDLDWDPPTQIVEAVAERTGVDVAAVRAMTMAGWVPWLTDTLDPANGQEVFDTYVRENSVILRPREAGRNQTTRWRPWIALQPGFALQCPVCATDPERGQPLMGRVPLLTSCGEHGCQLERADKAQTAAYFGEPLPPRPAAPHTGRMDRLTWQALTVGHVDLPGGTVHAGIWLRLLRTLLDEVTVTHARLSRPSADAMRTVWKTLGLPHRGGLTVWRPYEKLDLTLQQTMLHAAALALHLAETGEIPARGRWGRYLRVQPHHDVYEGDCRRYDLKQIEAELAQMIERARYDPNTGRTLVGWYTMGSRTVADFYRQRRFLLDQGIPEANLPDHVGMGRTDLPL